MLLLVVDDVVSRQTLFSDCLHAIQRRRIFRYSSHCGFSADFEKLCLQLSVASESYSLNKTLGEWKARIKRAGSR